MHDGPGVSTLPARAHRTWTPLGRALSATGDHWTLMIVMALLEQDLRFGQLQRLLPGVSTGVLERYVRRMHDLGLLERVRHRELPPRVEIRLTSTGLALVPIARAMARWGMAHMWSPPLDPESAAVLLLLRDLPALLEGCAKLPEGTLHAILCDEGEQPIRFEYRIRRGRLMAGGSREALCASVEGDTAAWIVALGPQACYEALAFAGDDALARGVLDALPDRAR